MLNLSIFWVIFEDASDEPDINWIMNEIKCLIWPTFSRE